MITTVKRFFKRIDWRYYLISYAVCVSVELIFDLFIPEYRKYPIAEVSFWLYLIFHSAFIAFLFSLMLPRGN